ncbi:unnamed protein product [Protopolystoma xenopodis]|uniref:Uncharacterized protein n=1 Tax=Protopolystoma xenopodis TaxID=117903 RepID=A0A448WMV6_9PLAT|nr:unnamed protein product [Protopolystoma xenopodis]
MENLFNLEVKDNVLYQIVHTQHQMIIKVECSGVYSINCKNSEEFLSTAGVPIAISSSGTSSSSHSQHAPTAAAPTTAAPTPTTIYLGYAPSTGVSEDSISASGQKKKRKRSPSPEPSEKKKRKANEKQQSNSSTSGSSNVQGKRIKKEVLYPFYLFISFNQSPRIIELFHCL